MSKKIKLSEDERADIRKKLEELILKFNGGEFILKQDFKDNRKATVLFTHSAWQKQQAAVSHFGKEVAWHGVCKRSETEEDTYVVEDIMVYPQEVTAATVNTDQEAYQNWLMALDDEHFNNCRYQAHSHVNMGVTPSTVDTTHQDSIISQIPDDGFYVFLIINKSGSIWAKVIDKATNSIFEKDEVKVVYEQEPDVSEFLKAADEVVKEKTYVWNYGNGYCGAYGSSYYGQKNTKPSKTTASKQSSTGEFKTLYDDADYYYDI